MYFKKKKLTINNLLMPVTKVYDDIIQSPTSLTNEKCERPNAQRSYDSFLV